MERTVRPRIGVAAIVLALLVAAVAVNKSAAAPRFPSFDRPAANGAARAGGTITPTETPPATLDSPADNALLPQPVAPGQWLFTWHAPRCGSTLHLAGPNGFSFVSPSVSPVGAPPSSFGYAYTQAVPINDFGPWTWHVEYDCGTYQGSSATRTFWVDGGATATPTPIQIELTSPLDGAMLPQPVAPHAWVFSGYGQHCGHTLYVTGPGGRSLVLPALIGNGPPPWSFGYAYTQPEPLPADALGPWSWYAENECNGQRSETRTFWVDGARITPTPATATPTLPEKSYHPFTLR